MTSTRSRRPAVLTLVALLLAAMCAVVVPASPADAAGRVTVVGLDGAARASADGPTTLKLSGSGFQSINKGFGGIYVLFGWVADGAWAPSQGGATGDTLRYVPDAETADNAGYQRFVAFPGSSTADEANGGLIAADGTWSTQLVVPGATFSTVDRSGATVEIDCTRVQCGVITIGAHGVKNAANESFTPVSFTGGGSSKSGSDDTQDAGAAASPGTSGSAGTSQDDAEQDASSDDGGAADDGGAGDGAASSAETKDEEKELPGKATLGFDQATAVAGRVLAFTGQGFEPGEQVLATLDGGVLAVGPLTAGNQGEVAGLLELPSDLRLGTHVLKVTGASSERSPEVEIIVTRDPAEAEAADALVASASGGAGGASLGGLAYSPAELAAGGALLLLLVLVVASAVTGARRRRGAKVAAASTAPATTDPATTENSTEAGS